MEVVRAGIVAKGYSSSLTEKVPSEFGADVIAIQCKQSRVGAKINKEAIRQLLRKIFNEDISTTAKVFLIN